VTNYLPQRYLLKDAWIFVLGLVFSISYLVLGKLERKDKILLGLPIVWFVWNLIAISLVESKIPNFIYQSYLLVLFAITLSVFLALLKITIQGAWVNLSEIADRRALVVILILTVLFSGYEGASLLRQLHIHRAQAYSYNTEHEKFYEVGEWMQEKNFTTKDLVIVRVSDSDCWFRYYPLFLTGAESKTLLEMNFGFDATAIKQKYQRMHFVMNPDDNTVFTIGEKQTVGDYRLVSFDLDNLSPEVITNQLERFIDAHRQDIDVDVLRIKKDLTSCQWLVPGYILNAP
jgi:hypothetical protein